MIGTGVQHSVRDLVQLAFGHLDLDWQDYVAQDERFLRPAEVDTLVADPSKARGKLGWDPIVDFEGLVRMMVDADLERLRTQPPEQKPS